MKTIAHRSGRPEPRALVTTVLCLALGAFLSAAPGSARAGCPSEEPPLLNFNGPGNVVCPCFIPGELAGVVLEAPADHYPITILRIGITWGSQFGGAPTSLEQAVRIFPAGLPNPGTSQYELLGPQLTDGFINEFDLTALPGTGSRVVTAGEFTVALEFLNTNSGLPFSPSVVHDGTACQVGKNAVFAIPGGWADACSLGVTGDWVMFAVYQRDCATGVEEVVVANRSAALLPARPNPFASSAEIRFFVEQAERVSVSVYDVAGQKVAQLADRAYAPGAHTLSWDGRGDDGRFASAGIYFVAMETGSYRGTQKITFTR